MPQEDKERLSPSSLPQKGSQIEQTDAALESATEAIEGKVTEIAKSGAGEDITTSGQQSQQKNSTEEDALEQDRAALRETLIQNAPDAPIMASQIKDSLSQKKGQIEKDMSMHLKSQNFHLFGEALKQLRQLLRDLQSVATLSIDALRDMWLRVVHNFG